MIRGESKSGCRKMDAKRDKKKQAGLARTCLDVGIDAGL